MKDSNISALYGDSTALAFVRDQENSLECVCKDLFSERQLTSNIWSVYAPLGLSLLNHQRRCLDIKLGHKSRRRIVLQPNLVCALTPNAPTQTHLSKCVCRGATWRRGLCVCVWERESPLCVSALVGLTFSLFVSKPSETQTGEWEQ